MYNVTLTAHITTTICTLLWTTTYNCIKSYYNLIWPAQRTHTTLWLTIHGPFLTKIKTLFNCIFIVSGVLLCFVPIRLRYFIYYRKKYLVLVSFSRFSDSLSITKIMIIMLTHWLRLGSSQRVGFGMHAMQDAGRYAMNLYMSISIMCMLSIMGIDWKESARTPKT